MFCRVQEGSVKKFLKSTKKTYDISQSLTASVLSKNDNALPELIIQDFDDEQVWQELELDNDSSISNFLTQIKTLQNKSRKVPITFCRKKASSTNKSVKFGIPSENEEKDDPIEGLLSGSEDEEITFKTKLPVDDFVDDEEEGSDNLDASQSGDSDSDIDKRLSDIKSRIQNDNSDDEDENDFDFDLDGMDDHLDESDHENENKDENEDVQNEDKNDNENQSLDSGNKTKSKDSNKKKQNKSVVDDKFFKLADMEAFLEQEEAKERKKDRKDENKDDDDDDDDESSVDMFQDIPSEDEVSWNYMYHYTT